MALLLEENRIATMASLLLSLGEYNLKIFDNF